MEQRLTIITLGVENHTRMRTCYRMVFGWEIAYNSFMEFDEAGNVVS